MLGFFYYPPHGGEGPRSLFIGNQPDLLKKRGFNGNKSFEPTPVTHQEIRGFYPFHLLSLLYKLLFSKLALDQKIEKRESNRSIRVHYIPS
jgi:hypothetical protein